jgi:hypothetical protein
MVFGLSLGSSKRAVRKATEDTAKVVEDAVATYTVAAGAGGREELKKIAVREDFTIVTDTARRMSWLGGFVLLVYAVVVLLVLLGPDTLAAANALANVGAVGAVVLIFVTSVVFAFVRNDQRAQDEFVKYSLGQAITDKLLQVPTLAQAVQEAMAALGQQDGDAAGKGVERPERIANFAKMLVLREGDELLGLHSIERTKRRLRLWGVGVFVVSLLCMGGIAGLSLVLSGQLGKIIDARAARRAVLRRRRRLALNDVVVSSGAGVEIGVSWSRGGLKDPASAGQSVSPLSVVYHAPFGQRSHAAAVALSDASVLLVGGAGPAADDRKGPLDASRAAFADVWKGSRDEAGGWVRWERVAANAGWRRRWGHQVVRLEGFGGAAGTLVLFGGCRGLGKEVLGDVWTSADEGATWTQLQSADGTVPPPRYLHAMTVISSRLVSGASGGEAIHLAGGVGKDSSTLTDEYWVGLPTAGSDGSLASIQWQQRSSAKWGVRVAPALQAVPISVPRLDTDTVAAIMAEDAAARTLPGTETPVVLGRDQVASIPEAFAARLRAVLISVKPTKQADLAQALADGWNSAIPQALVLAGGRQQAVDAAEEPAESDGLTVWRSVNSGQSWAREIKLKVKAAPERVGAAMAAVPTGDGRQAQTGTLVLTGGLGRGGVPLADVLVSSDAGASWKLAHPQGGSGGGGDDDTTDGAPTPNTLRRRAFHCLVRAGGDLVALAGDATGTPTDEVAALGITASGAEQEVTEAQAAAQDAVTDGGADDGQKTMTFVLVGLALVLLVLLLVMQFWFYRRYYKTIPEAYVKTEEAWRNALAKVADNPAAYDIGQSVKLQRSLSEFGDLAAVGSQSLAAGGSMLLPGF